MRGGVVGGLRTRARGAAHGTTGACVCGTAGDVLAERDDGVVVRHGGVVAKAHAGDTDTGDLAVRLALASHPALHGILLPPLTGPTDSTDPPDPTDPPGPTDHTGKPDPPNRPRTDPPARTWPPDPPGSTGPVAGRPVSLWPYGAPVDPASPELAPWEAAGDLLARLHRVDTARLTALPGPLPPMRGPAKAARAVRRMRATTPEPLDALARYGDADAVTRVEAAWRTLPPWARDEAPPPPSRTLCHGDLHLGQLVRAPATPAPQGGGPWLLIDIDDLGVGDAAWDLARPAAWFACGLLGPGEWARFLGAYRSAGGPAVPAAADPWPALDVAARTLTVQTAALAVVRSRREQRPPDEDERAVIDACARMAGTPMAE
ncbi:phosphotransferase family protein [Streptomyces uncialis]|uniref:phosphotransferase family protein n=1 Tax=Streptomyces uncialis TaxID=1048205 RepID=UPI003791CA7E